MKLVDFYSSLCYKNIMTKETFTAVLYNTGYKKEGFSSVEEALSFIKKACFEGCVLNKDTEVLISWSPIGGVIWRAEHAY